MWWNFVGRDHDEIVHAARTGWPRSPTTTARSDSQEIYDGRFGIVEGDHLPPIPAPAPPRHSRGRSGSTAERAPERP